METTANRDHRPALSTWIIIGAIWGPLAVVGVLVAVQVGQFAVLWIGLGGALVSVVMLSRVRLQWSSEGLVYRSIFGSHAIRFQEIESAGVSGRRGPFAPAILLEIRPRDRQANAVFDINLKLFSTEAAIDLRDVLVEHGVEIR